MLDLNVERGNGLSFEFLVLDKNDQPTAPYRVNPIPGVKIDHDTTRDVMRHMTDFVLKPGDAELIRPGYHRIQPVAVFDDDTSSGFRKELGVFLFVEFRGRKRSAGGLTTCELVDKGFIADQQFRKSGVLRAGMAVDLAMRRVIDYRPAYAKGAFIDPTGHSLGQALEWSAEDTVLAWANEMGSNYGYHKWSVDHKGIARCQDARDPKDAMADLDYDLFPRVYGQPETWEEWLSSPNVWAVYDTSATEGVIRGEYSLPAEHRNSEYERGFDISRSQSVSGLSTISEAANAAYKASLIDAGQFAYCEFAGPIDPRHDSFNIVKVLDEKWLEIKWNFVLAEGEQHHHVLMRFG